jgi:hypothetical protein
MQRVPFANVSLFVHASGDIVSTAIMNLHSWEPHETQQMLW